MSMHEPIGFQPLEGPLRKIGRARHHYDELRRLCQSFMDEEPYGWRVEYHDLPEGRRSYTVYAEITDDPDPAWGLIAGDVIQNLRAALDQLVWGISDPAARGTHTAFPIYLDEDAYRDNSPRKIEGVTERGRGLIDGWQPYHWKAKAADRPLAILQQLSNLDKHRSLLPVAIARRREYVAGFGEFRIEEFTSHRRRIANGDEERAFSFITSGEPPDEVKANAYLTFEMTIEERTLLELESIFIYVGTEIIGWFDRG